MGISAEEEVLLLVGEEIHDPNRVPQDHALIIWC